jgi:DNA-binding transcriptional LysR family regulator
LALALPAKGRFLTVLPASVLRFGAKQLALKILPIELPIAPRPVRIIWLKNRMLNPVAQLFIDCARGLALPMAENVVTTT